MRHSTTEKPILNNALPGWPARRRSIVCKLNDEKVVNPPHTPTMKAMRQISGTGKRPWSSVNAPKNEIANEPIILTTMVPQGRSRLIGSIQRASQYQIGRAHV